MYEYRSQFIRAVDGDTIEVDLDLGCWTWIRGMKLRLLNVDTPERGYPDFERATQTTHTFCHDLCHTAPIIRTHLDKRGKFGRLLATVVDPATGNTLNDLLIAQGWEYRR